ncbi:MAG: glycoside hydrolase family 3 N-terminal domain-containing protein, partial [Thermodesulfobacteriota bacterium]|nr:glycoside hydrolase family 3 N-terminal domain-containing protein [Thermodesulfobacteriota bacterium]
TAKELTEIGINMNMAPVLDVAPKGILMSERVFGDDPIWVSKLGVKVIDHLQQNKIMSVAKHFPGIGRTTLDSHLDMPLLNADIADLEAVDFLPFKAAIKHHVSGIMLSHIFYKKIDPKWPASLSNRIAKDLLRKQMGFNGIVMTDDLNMGAIKKNYDIKTIIQRMLSADIDIALICHKGPDIEGAFYEILNALKSSQKIMTKGMESVERILEVKQKYIINFDEFVKS